MSGAAWTCPSCGQKATSAFCPSCGERPLSPRDLTLRGLLGQLGYALTSIDGRLLRSFRILLSRPGELTVATLAGRRKPFISPVQIFFVANVLFFAMQSLTGVKVFSTPLATHLSRQPWSVLARRWVEHHVASAGTTIERYAPVFDRAVALHAKSWIVLMVLPLAVLPPLLFRRKARPFAAHLWFSIHFYAFFLVAASVVMLVPFVDQKAGGAGLESEPLDDAVTIVLLAATATYLFLAIGRVYDSRGLGRGWKTAALTAAVAAIALAYRFALFAITLATT